MITRVLAGFGWKMGFGVPKVCNAIVPGTETVPDNGSRERLRYRGGALIAFQSDQCVISGGLEGSVRCFGDQGFSKALGWRRLGKACPLGCQ
jgi:hypothetical protein